MLCFDLRELERHGLQVDGALAPDDPVWEASDQRPSGPVRATGRLSAAGPNRYYWNGQVEGTVEGSCRRCLAPAHGTVREPVHLFFAEGEEDVDDPDVYRVPARASEIDLRPAIREQWLLSAPALLLCRADCAGLCPQCGAELNGGPCGCTPSADSRWDALRSLRDVSS